MATVTAGYNWVSGETVTPAKLNSAAAPTVALTAEERTPAGAIMAFAMNAVPSGWLAANGDAVSRSTYAALFAVIGTGYGVGDGSTTFNLPDLRGYFVRGAGLNSDGTNSGNFAAKQAAAMLDHAHTGTTSDESAQHGHSVNAVVTSANTGTGAGITVGGNGYFLGTVATTFNGSGHTHTVTTGNPSTGGGTETRPANIALLYCIKF
jgi:microcystin-dependent protein